MTRTLTLGLALIGLAGLSQSANANSCLPQHGSYIRSAHFHSVQFDRAPRLHRHVHYVVIERPRYRTMVEVYEPVPAATYDEPYWQGPEPAWAPYDDGPYLHADYYGGW